MKAAAGQKCIMDTTRSKGIVVIFKGYMNCIIIPNKW